MKIKYLKRLFMLSRYNAAKEARSQCLKIVEDTIEECDAIECWNYTAKRIRDKIAALDHADNS